MTARDPDTPPPVQPLGATELKAMLDAGKVFELVDVRTEGERGIARIAGARLLDQPTYDDLIERDRDTTIVFHCHFGDRSRAAAEHFRQHGFTSLYNLEGGIDAWSRTVDPSVPRY
jgi:monothiol glutaredoxin